MLVIKSFYPRAEEYLRNKWFFDEYVRLGVFHESDYSYSRNYLAFRLNSYIAKHYIRFSQSIEKEINELLLGVERKDLVGFHIRMGDQLSELRRMLISCIHMMYYVLLIVHTLIIHPNQSYILLLIPVLLNGRLTI